MSEDKVIRGKNVRMFYKSEEIKSITSTEETENIYKGLSRTKDKVVEAMYVPEKFLEGDVSFTVKPLSASDEETLWKLGYLASEKDGTHLDEATGLQLDQLAEMVGIIRQPPEEIHHCQYNDCGWCYYKGDGNSNDNNGTCNKPQQCEVNINE